MTWPKEIGKHEHFSSLASCSSKTWPHVEQHFYKRLSNTIIQKIQFDADFFLARRRGRPLLRPYLTSLCRRLESADDCHELYAATELINISTYQSNLVFDHKMPEQNQRNDSNQIICSMISLSAAFDALSLTQLDAGTVQQCVSYLNRCNRDVYEGQYIDLNILNFLTNPESTQFDEPEFLSLYKERCRNIGGSTYKQCIIGALSSGVDPATCEILKDYLVALGIAGQILNDLADFIPKTARGYTEGLSDLTEGRLTYVNYLLAKSKIDILSLAKRARCGALTTREFADLRDHISTSGVTQKVLSLLRSVCWPAIRRGILHLHARFPAEQAISFTFARNYIFTSRLLRYFQ